MVEPFPLHRFHEIELAINDQLSSYANVPKALWFREICFCLLTPQSSPFNAELRLIDLEKHGLFEEKLNEQQVAEILRSPYSYIRFHNQKAKRLISILKKREQIEKVLFSQQSPESERNILLNEIQGFGLKETSHALRNIGRFGFGILDRHILRALVKWGAIKEIPKSINNKIYFECEDAMRSYAKSVKISIDQLDVFMWAEATGLIFK